MILRPAVGHPGTDSDSRIQKQASKVIIRSGLVTRHTWVLLKEQELNQTSPHWSISQIRTYVLSTTVILKTFLAFADYRLCFKTSVSSKKIE